MSNAQNRIDLGEMTIDAPGRRSQVVLRPGEVVRLNASNEYEHRPAGAGVDPVRVVLTKQQSGGGINDSYAVGETVRVGIPHQGSAFNVRLGGDENVTVPDILEMGANGLVTEGATNPLFQTVESAPIVTGTGETALAAVLLTS